MKFKIVLLMTVLALATPLLAACGGGDAGESGNAFTVSANDDFVYTPDTITVGAGQEVTLTFENEGSVEHSFNILKTEEELEHVLEEAHEEEELHEELLLEVHELEPGGSATETFTAPSESGEYAYFCSLPGHADAGLVGTLIVEQ